MEWRNQQGLDRGSWGKQRMGYTVDVYIYSIFIVDNGMVQGVLRKGTQWGGGE